MDSVINTGGRGINQNPSVRPPSGERDRQARLVTVHSGLAPDGPGTRTVSMSVQVRARHCTSQLE